MGLVLLDEMTLPCITMVGTRLTFYLVPVTKELSNAVVNGASETKVRKLRSQSRWWYGGPNI